MILARRMQKAFNDCSLIAVRQAGGDAWCQQWYFSDAVLAQRSFDDMIDIQTSKAADAAHLLQWDRNAPRAGPGGQTLP